jgi:regulator of replication initiation timing
MTDIAELERRISAALDRIGQNIEHRGKADAGLEAELAAAKEENAALHARLGAMQTEWSEGAGRTAADVERLGAELDAAIEEAARLRQVNDALRESNRALREAAVAALPDAGLVDAAMRTELDALRTARDADRAELDAILATLEPLVEERTHA